MQFEWTVNIGNLLTAAVLLAGFLKAHQQNIKKLASIEERVDMMFRWFTAQVINHGKGN
jgi:hypothetical protein